MQIGLNQNDKNGKSRTNEEKSSSSSMLKSLSDVFGFGAQSGGLSDQQAFLETADNLDGVDDGGYGKDALIEAAMDLNYEMVNFMNNNSFGASTNVGGGGPGGGVNKYPVISMTPAPTPPMLADDLTAAISETTPLSSTQSSSAVFDAWPPLNAPGFKPYQSAMQVTSAKEIKSPADEQQPPSDDMLKIEYSKPKVNLVISQCIRLPTTLNDASFTVHSIVPALDGANLFVVVNRTTPTTTATKISSAILVYPLIFNNSNVTVQERPYRQCFYDHDVGAIKSIVLTPKDWNVGQKLENVVVLSEKGEILVVDAENGRIITRANDSLEEKARFTSITYVSGRKITKFKRIFIFF